MALDVGRSWFSGFLPDYWENLDSVQTQVYDPLVQKLFRIFLMLAERSTPKLPSDVQKNVLWIHADEVRLFVSILNHHLPVVRRDSDAGICQHGFYHYCGFDSGSMFEANQKLEHTFKEFAIVLSKLFPYNREEFMIALIIVYDNLVNQVLKKGFLLWSSRKSGGLLRSWQRRWAVVKPGLVTFYKDQSENEKLKEVFLSNRNDFEVVEAKSALSANGFPLYEFELKISSDQRRYAATFDVLQRRQWITALHYACRASIPQRQQPNPTSNVHRRAFLKRRQIRIGKSAKNSHQTPTNDVPVQRSASNGVVISLASTSSCTTTTEKATTSKEQELFEEALLEEEEKLWQNLPVEELCKELKNERIRANRFWVTKKELQEQFEKAQTAIKDEEIVRNLATRLFEEERSRRNALEEMNQQQAKQLEFEQQQRQNAETTEHLRNEEIQRLKNELHQLQSCIVKKPTIVQHSTPQERRELLASLKRDQEALLKHQLEIKNELQQQQLDCSQRFEEAKSILNRLLENSKKRALANCRP